MATILTALIEGVLYAVSPQLTFGLATAVGIVGPREFLYFIRPRYEITELDVTVH